MKIIRMATRLFLTQEQSEQLQPSMDFLKSIHSPEKEKDGAINYYWNCDVGSNNKDKAEIIYLTLKKKD